MNVNCSTCLELLSPSDDLSSAPCGHIFHSPCIIQWIETGKSSCPQCRAKCFERQLRRVFFTEAANVTLDSQTNVNTLQDRLDSLTFKLRCSDKELTAANEAKDKAIAQTVALRSELRDTEERLAKAKEEKAIAKQECRLMLHEKDKIEKAKKKVKALEEQLEQYKHIDFIINETSVAVNKKLHELCDFSKATKDSTIIIGNLSLYLSNKFYQNY